MLKSMIANNGSYKLEELFNNQTKCTKDMIIDQIVLNKILQDMLDKIKQNEFYKLSQVKKALIPLV